VRKALALVVVIALASLGGVSDARAVSCTPALCGFPPLVATFGGSVSPMRLSTTEYAPVRWSVFGKIKTSDGTHPSAFREAIIDIDKDVKINVRGYPTCKAGRLATRDAKAALKVCGGAVVGSGNADIEIASSELSSLTGNSPLTAFGDLLENPLTVFNGGESGGKIKLLIQTFVAMSVPVIAEVTISRKGRRLHSVARAPVIADGNGSLVDFKFTLGKTYTYKGKKVGYFEAKCPDGVFKVTVPKVLFKNEAHIPGVAATTVVKDGLAVPCTPKG
jgi:hypothetical protein